jgi:hypothetical protein
MIVEGIAEPDIAAGAPFVIGLVVEIVGLGPEQIETRDQVAVEEVGICDRQIGLAFLLRQRAADGGVDAGADQVAFAEAEASAPTSVE